MKWGIMVLALVLAAPLAAVGGEAGGEGWAGGRRIALAGRLGDREGATAAAESPFQFNLAAVVYFTSNGDVKEFINLPLYGADAGVVYWFSDQYGVGLSGQYLYGQGTSGRVHSIQIDAECSYTNVFFNFQGRLPLGDRLAIYFLTGLGYSNIQLDGEGDVGPFVASINGDNSGVSYQVGVSFEGPWVYGDLRFVESSFREKSDGSGGALYGFEFMIGLRTPLPRPATASSSR